VALRAEAKGAPHARGNCRRPGGGRVAETPAGRPRAHRDLARAEHAADLGSIGKGYAADQALQILKGRGIDRALVAASGDIAVGNPPPGQRGWKIGITMLGSATNAAPRTVLLHNAGISTSGDTEQFIEINGVHYSHIVNPATGLGLTNRIQATVIGPDATTTDCLDTTLSLLGVKRGLALADSLPHIAALIVTRDDGQTHTFRSRRFRQIPQPR